MTGASAVLRARAREASYRTRYLLNAYPAFYMPMGRVRHRGKSEYLVQRETELVIEGCGRAGSTFAVIAFNSAQSRPVRLAHHTHAAAQVLTAVKWGIPTLVIVRPPLDSALAHMARRDIPARPALVSWIRFHRRILPVRHGFVAVSFADMTSDFGAAVVKVNEAFGTSFGVFDHTPENEVGVFAAIEGRNRDRWGEQMTPERARSLARPTPERAAKKERLRTELEAPGLAGLRAQAHDLYQTLVGQPAAVA
ncbi:MAG TPA: hypothetical protein VGL44_05920 [Gaiellales bacterium]